MPRRLLPAKKAFAFAAACSEKTFLEEGIVSDMKVMKQVGLENFEFACEWSEILPKGRGPVRQKGLDLYDRRVDELLEHGITPQVSLGAERIPENLTDKGGWSNRDSLSWFADYARLIASTLGDRVKDWVTHSDPEALRIDTGIKGWMQTYHGTLSQAYAREAMLGEHAGQRIGFGLRFWAVYPASDRSRDHEATLRFEAQHLRFYLDLLYKGEFNDIALQMAKASGTGDIDFMREADKHHLKGAADFLRLDYAFLPAIDVEDPPSFTRSGRLARKSSKKSEPYTDRRSSERLLESLLKLQKDYAPGDIRVATRSPSSPAEDGGEASSQDIARMLYHSHHLQAVAEAIEKGVPLRSYLWQPYRDSSTENEGFIAIDEDENRSLKASAYWLKALIETRDPHWESGVDYQGMD